MACFYPCDAWYHSKSRVLLLKYNPKFCHSIKPDLQVACGRCVGCRLDKSRQWAIRCMHEAKMWPDNCFITLTFASFSWISTRRLSSDDLEYRHFQLFMKRLRKRFPESNIRFYMAGEYGDQFGRPHFHACLFNFNFPDRDFLFRTPSGEVIYRSKILEDLWPYGFSSIGEVTYESAAYVARYCMKKIGGDMAEDHYRVVNPYTGEVIQRTPEFNRMSLKPGIGATWFNRYSSDVFPRDSVIDNNYRESRVPRYYDKLYARISSEAECNFEHIKIARVAKVQLDDNTPERLKVREQVVLANLSKKKRNLS